MDDHRGFHLAVGRAVLAGGALALLGSLFAVPEWGRGLFAVLLLCPAIAPPRTFRQGAWVLLCALLAGGATAMGAQAPILSSVAFSLCLGLGLAHTSDGPRWQKALTGVSGFLLCLGGSRLPQALAGQDGLQALPGQVAVLLGGMGMGLIVGSAAVVRRLRVQVEAVGQSPRRLALSERELLALLPAPATADRPDDEIARLLRQSVATYKEAAEALSEHPAAPAAAEDLVKRIVRFGKRWREIEAQANKSDPAELSARMEDLRRRQESTSDEQAQAEYEWARMALAAQLSYLTEIADGRERAVARLHHQVATLERLRLAAVRLRSADATRMGEELRAVIEDLSRAGRDLDSDAEALAEVY